MAQRYREQWLLDVNRSSNIFHQTHYSRLSYLYYWDFTQVTNVGHSYFRSLFRLRSFSLRFQWFSNLLLALWFSTTFSYTYNRRPVDHRRLYEDFMKSMGMYTYILLTFYTNYECFTFLLLLTLISFFSIVCLIMWGDKWTAN